MSVTGRLPDWLRRPIPRDACGGEVRRTLDELKLNTVCHGAQCPNRTECFARRTATFMILGAECTRACRFCAVEAIARPASPDPTEPERVARASRRLKLRHVVVTSVTRDDLDDGGAEHFAQTIKAIREALSCATVEVLTPDFRGRRESIETVVRARPDIFNHNVETVPSLYASVRPQADYRRSLDVLHVAKEIARAEEISLLTKSGIMVGLGESADQLDEVMTDLRTVDCDILTVGQYLAPSAAHYPVARFVPPEEFETIEQKAKEKGFRAVFAGPFVRSSYLAENVFEVAEGKGVD